jgi:hypothetical protein
VGLTVEAIGYLPLFRLVLRNRCHHHVTGERPEESSRGTEIGKFVNGYVLTAIRRASAETGYLSSALERYRGEPCRPVVDRC